MQTNTPMAEEIDDRATVDATKASKKFALLALAALSGVFLASVLFKPSAGEYFTVCGFKNLTGLPCPGCGLTHSFCALGNGDISGAFAFNLLGPPLFLVFALVWMRSASVLVNRNDMARKFDRMAARLDVVRVLAIAFAIYGIVRIAYVVVYGPTTFRDSPLSQLITKLVR